MAIMIPRDMKAFNFTQSEKVMYERLKGGLSNKYWVYFSVSYHQPDLSHKGEIRTGELDFVILHPDMGLLALEVKSGRELSLDNGQWQLKLSDHDYRVLSKSPLKQAEDGTHALMAAFRKKHGKVFSGNYGYAVALPFFNVKNEDMGVEIPRELILDFSDMEMLESKIELIYKRFDHKNRLDKDDFVNMNRTIHEKRFYGITTAQELAFHEERLAEINFVQDSVLKLLENYNRVKFNGAAGTGKTWIAMKKALECARQGKRTLLTCHNKALGEFMDAECRKHLNDVTGESVTILNYSRLLNLLHGRNIFQQLAQEERYDLIEASTEAMDYISDEHKFDAIIVDEGQDFREEWQILLQGLLKDENESLLYVFYDVSQNIFDVDFAQAFFIESPDFLLNDNLRNTREIHDFALKWGEIERDVISRVEGMEPEIIEAKDGQQGVKELKALYHDLVVENKIKNHQILLLSNRSYDDLSILPFMDKLTFKLVKSERKLKENEVYFRKIQKFKGLESDVVIYLEYEDDEMTSDSLISDKKMLRYVAYTRAKFILKVIRVKS